MKPILVVGSTGLTGSHICEILKREGKSIRALVRKDSDESKKQALRDLGAELIEGDLKDRSSLDKACEGVGAVISTASSTLSRRDGDTIQSVDSDGQCALIDAAKTSGVEKFVFVSFRENKEIDFPLSKAKRAVENKLKGSGMNYAILQASWFMEVWLSPALGFDFASGNVRVYGDGANKVSWVSYKDVAEASVAALEKPIANNAVLDIGGPEALSPAEAVKKFEAKSGKTFSVENVSVADLRSQKDGAPDPLQASFSGLMLCYAAGDAMPDARDTASSLGINLTSVDDYVAAVCS